MILETTSERARFAISNSPTPASDDGSSWVVLDAQPYTLPQFGNGNIGSCPSIRFDAASGYYYVLTGGYEIIALRSTDLVNWTLATASAGGAVLEPDASDCSVAQGWAGTYVPTSTAAGYMQACVNGSLGPHGFGDDSDVDLTEIIGDDGTVSTLLEYGSGNQATFGFSNLAIANAGMFPWLSSLFEDDKHSM